MRNRGSGESRLLAQANRNAWDAVADAPVAVDLFSGVGGLSLGLEAAGFHVGVDVEIEEISGRYAQYNFPLSSVLHGEGAGDVRSIDAARIRSSLRWPKREIALVAGGPPCQGFSVAGRKDAGDPLNFLVLEFARVVLDVKPLAFLMENVPGITTQGSAKLAKCMKMLGECYNVSEPTVLAAWNYGVPQMRKRVFILGIRKDLGTAPSFPQPTHIEPSRSPTFLSQAPSVWDAISDIPDVDKYPELISGDRIPYERAPETDYQAQMRAEQPAMFSHVFPREWDSEICTNLRRTRHGAKILSAFSSLQFGEIERSSGIRRLEPHALSTTIRAGTTKARGSWSAPRPLHPFQHRVLTTRECARIQSFPDWFFFHPTKWHGNRMVGNAVPPLLAQAVGKQILALLKIRVTDAQLPTLVRDQSLVAADIEAAANSNFENRAVSQMVVPWSRREPA